MKQWTKRLGAILTAMFFAVLICLPGSAAGQQTLEELLPKVQQLQQLAQTYVQQTQSTAQPLELTVNYIRAERYSDSMWDMVLGKVDEEFADFVQQQDSSLQQLQTQQNVVISATGEPVDFVHLIAGIGATERGISVICTWGGDCVQLAESIKGNNGTEQDCISALKSYFAAADENSSLFPQSDWIADQDGVNIGSELTGESDLAQQMSDYYAKITPKERAYQFVQNQFGQADTSQTQEFRDLVKQTFLQDAGVQLFLMADEYVTLDENKNAVIVPSMQQPLNAACSLVADSLAQTLEGETVAAQTTASPAPTQAPQTNQPVSPDESLLSQAKTDFIHSVIHSPQIFLYIAGIAFVGILAILIFTRR